MLFHAIYLASSCYFLDLFVIEFQFPKSFFFLPVVQQLFQVQVLTLPKLSKQSYFLLRPAKPRLELSATCVFNIVLVMQESSTMNLIYEFGDLGYAMLYLCSDPTVLGLQYSSSLEEICNSKEIGVQGEWNSGETKMDWLSGQFLFEELFKSFTLVSNENIVSSLM